MHVFAYDRFERLKASLPTLNDLIAFHRAYTSLLKAKDEKFYRELENIVANQSELSFDILFGKYELEIKTAISCKSSIALSLTDNYEIT